MPTTSNVVPFPRPIRPDKCKCLAAVAQCDSDPAALFNAALLVLNYLDGAKRLSPPPSAQVLANGLTIALLALAELLGVTRAVEGQL